jgi:hypothetical protein
MGSWLSAVAALGVSTKVIEGPAVSSEDIAVRGVGFDVNFGNDCRRIWGGLTSDFASEELERCEDELATLWDFGGFAAPKTAVSEAVASGCGLSGVIECVVGLSSFCGVLFLRESFHITLRRSCCLVKEEVLGAVFCLVSDVLCPL